MTLLDTGHRDNTPRLLPLACAATLALALASCASTPAVTVTAPPVAITGPGGITGTVSTSGGVLTLPQTPVTVDGITLTPTGPATITVAPGAK